MRGKDLEVDKLYEIRLSHAVAACGRLLEVSGREARLIVVSVAKDGSRFSYGTDVGDGIALPLMQVKRPWDPERSPAQRVTRNPPPPPPTSDELAQQRMAGAGRGLEGGRGVPSVPAGDPLADFEELLGAAADVAECRAIEWEAREPLQALRDIASSAAMVIAAAQRHLAGDIGQRGLEVPHVLTDAVEHETLAWSTADLDVARERGGACFIAYGEPWQRELQRFRETVDGSYRVLRQLRAEAHKRGQGYLRAAGHAPLTDRGLMTPDEVVRAAAREEQQRDARVAAVEAEQHARSERESSAARARVAAQEDAVRRHDEARRRVVDERADAVRAAVPAVLRSLGGWPTFAALEEAGNGELAREMRAVPSRYGAGLKAWAREFGCGPEHSPAAVALRVELRVLVAERGGAFPTMHELRDLGRHDLVERITKTRSAFGKGIGAWSRDLQAGEI